MLSYEKVLRQARAAHQKCDRWIDEGGVFKHADIITACLACAFCFCVGIVVGANLGVAR